MKYIVPIESWSSQGDNQVKDRKFAWGIHIIMAAFMQRQIGFINRIGRYDKRYREDGKQKQRKEVLSKQKTTREWKKESLNIWRQQLRISMYEGTSHIFSYFNKG